MKFNTEKCKVLHSWWKNEMHRYRIMGNTCLKETYMSERGSRSPSRRPQVEHESRRVCCSSQKGQCDSRLHQCPFLGGHPSEGEQGLVSAPSPPGLLPFRILGRCRGRCLLARGRGSLAWPCPKPRPSAPEVLQAPFLRWRRRRRCLSGSCGALWVRCCRGSGAERPPEEEEEERRRRRRRRRRSRRGASGPPSRGPSRRPLRKPPSSAWPWPSRTPRTQRPLPTRTPRPPRGAWPCPVVPPQASERLAAGVQQAVIAVASAYYQLPKGQGTTLRKAVRDATVEMVEGMIQLTEAILRAPTLRSVSREQLVSTGGVWEACDRVSALPRDNQAAVALVLSSCLGVVKDALEEMEQAQTEGGDPYGDVLDDDDLGSRGNQDVYWSEADRRLLGPCLGLVKSAKACLKKVLGAVKAHGQVDTAEHVAQLDDLADIAGDVSPSVDELALSTYPPVNQLTLRLNAAKLASVLKKMLEITRASHVCPPSEEGWVQFLAGAVDHNLDRIKGLTQGLL